jgi:hypothetical protein
MELALDWNPTASRPQSRVLARMAKRISRWGLMCLVICLLAPQHSRVLAIELVFMYLK